MIINTVRDQADLECEKIKNVIKTTSLDFYIQESPYSLKLQIRKSFIQDFSPKIDPDFNPTSFNLESTKTSSPIKVSSLLPAHLSQNNDSGCGDVNILETARSELVKSLLETGSLKNELEDKKAMIIRLNSKLNSLDDINKNLQSDISTKNNQLKEKNKKFDSLKSKYENLLKDKETKDQTLRTKIESVKTKNDSLQKEIVKIETDLKNEKRKSLNLESKSKEREKQKKELIQEKNILKEENDLLLKKINNKNNDVDIEKLKTSTKDENPSDKESEDTLDIFVNNEELHDKESKETAHDEITKSDNLSLSELLQKHQKHQKEFLQKLHNQYKEPVPYKEMFDGNDSENSDSTSEEEGSGDSTISDEEEEESGDSTNSEEEESGDIPNK